MQTKEELIEALLNDSHYFMNFTADAAKDFFFKEHRKMKKEKLREIIETGHDGFLTCPDAAKYLEKLKVKENEN